MGVTDIDAIIRQWAERRSAAVYGQKSPNLGPASRNNSFEIDWSKVRFSTHTTTFTPRLYEDSCQRSHVVFKSNYENRTNEVQNHTFQMERTTDATVRTRVTKGFSRNGLVGIQMDIPDNVSNQTGSFGSEIHLVSEDENTVKHGISWGLNSTVKAPAGMRTVAELKITETEHQCDFASEVIIRGRVIVRILNGDSPQVIEGDLATILQDERNQQNVNDDGMINIQGRKVTWTVSGNLKFKFGVSQDVKVWSERL